MSLKEDNFSGSKFFDGANVGSELRAAKLLFVNVFKADEPKIKPKFFIKFLRSR